MISPRSVVLQLIEVVLIYDDSRHLSIEEEFQKIANSLYDATARPVLTTRALISLASTIIGNGVTLDVASSSSFHVASSEACINKIIYIMEISAFNFSDGWHSKPYNKKCCQFQMKSFFQVATMSFVKLLDLHLENSNYHYPWEDTGS